MRQTMLKTKEFLDPADLLAAVPVEPGMVVADFGCGNGYYSVAAGALAGKKGKVYAIDIFEEALSQTSSLAKLTGLNNVSTRQCDLERFGNCKIEETACDLVIISSLLHQVNDKLTPLKEAYRLLKTQGKLLVVEWKAAAMFGPPPAERISREDVESILQKNGFRPVRELPAGSFHYALLYEK